MIFEPIAATFWLLRDAYIYVRDSVCNCVCGYVCLFVRLRVLMHLYANLKKSHTVADAPPTATAIVIATVADAVATGTA